MKFNKIKKEFENCENCKPVKKLNWKKAKKEIEEHKAYQATTHYFKAGLEAGLDVAIEIINNNITEE